MSQVVVRLADICNLECKMCDFVNSSNTYGQMMDINDFKKIIDKLKNRKLFVGGQKIEIIRIDGNREGLLYPKIDEAVHIVNEAGFRSFIVTNGVNADEQMAKRLLKAGLNSINFSVSGITEETYSEFQGYRRPKEQLKKVLDNIRNFIRVRNELGECWIGCSMLMNGKNNLADEYREALLQYKAMGVNSVLIGSEYPKCNVKEAVGSPNCLTIPLIGVDGEVFPCCGGSESISLGNIFQDEAENIFNGDKIDSLRKGLKRSEGFRLPQACMSCIYNGLPARKTETFWMKGETDFRPYLKGFSDFCANSFGKKVYVIGANELAEELIQECEKWDIRIEGIIDNDSLKWGKKVYGIPIIEPGHVFHNEVYVSCIRNQNTGVDFLQRYSGDKYLYAMFLECFYRHTPVFSYSYVLN